MTKQLNEWYFCTGLLDTVFGEYKPANYEGDLPNTAEVKVFTIPQDELFQDMRKYSGS